VQDGNNLYIGDEKTKTSSHESFGFMPYNFSIWKEGINIENIF